MNVQEFASSLFELHTDMHIAHLQTNKYSDHMALNDIYQEIVELRDRFIETYQGYNGIIKGYKIELHEGVDYVKYLENKAKEYAEFRLTLSNGSLQQIVDDINELITSGLYKLKYLTK